MVLAFVILADYQFENLGKIAGDIYLLTIILYLVVFAYGFLEVINSLKNRNRELAVIEQKRELEKQNHLLIRVNRKHVKLKLQEIQYIESLGDYVQVVTQHETCITKERISALEKTLPACFLRIHRSFIVNQAYITSFNKEKVTVVERELTIGRKYKEVTLRELTSARNIKSDISAPLS